MLRHRAGDDRGDNRNRRRDRRSEAKKVHGIRSPGVPASWKAKNTTRANQRRRKDQARFESPVLAARHDYRRWPSAHRIMNGRADPVGC